MSEDYQDDFNSKYVLEDEAHRRVENAFLWGYMWGILTIPVIYAAVSSFI